MVAFYLIWYTATDLGTRSFHIKTHGKHFIFFPLHDLSNILSFIIITNSRVIYKFICLELSELQVKGYKKGKLATVVKCVNGIGSKKRLLRGSNFQG